MPEKISAFTIVSKNYIAHARTLAKSFLKQYPDIPFYTILVDECDRHYSGTDEPFTLIQCKDLPLPARDYFIYQYDIMELNTAVKPFTFQHMFDIGYSQVIYFDPDIYIFSQMSEIIPANDNVEAILIPHLTSPYCDSLHPNDLDILRSGTYNLGFLSLNKTCRTRRFLDWWCEKLFTDCVVDIENGLFVDQKWMDLAPAMLNAQILKHPGYNVAYWNLHERTLEGAAGGYLVNGSDLKFFHYSGFSATNPFVLSKHETRHKVQKHSELSELLKFYSNKLIESGFIEAEKYEYAYSVLPNGVRMSRPFRRIIRNSLKKNIKIPSPCWQPERFCKFITTPNLTYSNGNVAPIVSSILAQRPDVRDAFPEAATNKHDEGFNTWFYNSFVMEHQADEFVSTYGGNLNRDSATARIIGIYEKREDLRKAYPDAFSSVEDHQRFCEWCALYGRSEEGIDDSEITQFKSSISGFSRIVNIYFARPDLMAAFPDIHIPETIDSLADWASRELTYLDGVNIDAIQFFRQCAKSNQLWLLKANLLYNQELHNQRIGASIFLFAGVDLYLRRFGTYGFANDLKKWLMEGSGPNLLVQLNLAYKSDNLAQRLYRDAFSDHNSSNELLEYLIGKLDLQLASDAGKTLLRDVDGYLAKAFNSHVGANLFGYFDTPTGMGESARSLLRVLSGCGINTAVYSLPCQWPKASVKLPLDMAPDIYGLPDPTANTNIWIVNADELLRVQNVTMSIAPDTSKNIGYWVWETDLLPVAHAESEAAVSEIWTPSEYSAEAIRKAVDTPVKVIPHCASLDKRPSEKYSVKLVWAEIGCEKRAFKVLYIFDVKSGIERKNPKAAIKAFLSAFPGNENACLILKSSGATPGDFPYQQLKARYRDKRIFWVEDILPEENLRALQQGIDCYLSLHRSEGFGLTMLESMTYGRPVVATGYSGNLAFMNDDNSFLVDYDLVDAARRYGPYSRGTRWADPSVHDAAGKLRKVYEGGGDVRQRLKQAAETVSAFSPASIAQRSAHIIKDALGEG